MKQHNKIKSSVVVKLHNDGVHWTVVQEIKYIINNQYFVVPKGFTTDFASVPKVLKGVVPNKAIYNQIAILHDYLYSTHEVTRKEADLILKKGIELLYNNSKSGKIWANLFYRTVRWFGGSHWNN